LFGNLATDRFLGKLFLENRRFSTDGSNDAGLKFVSRPGAEPIDCPTHTHTEYVYYNIDGIKYKVNILWHVESLAVQINK
jgi:hypothetical protein